jgi:hypothetical protein
MKIGKEIVKCFFETISEDVFTDPNQLISDTIEIKPERDDEIIGAEKLAPELAPKLHLKIKC